MSNYPPGVTGFEYAIAGADVEFDETREVEHDCDEARFDGPFQGDAEVSVSRYGYSETVTYTCPQCGASVEFEAEAEDDSDPDSYYDD